MEWIEYPEEKARSPQYRALPLCNGAATGRCCKYYWATISYADVMNPGDTNRGEKGRLCLLPHILPEMRFLGEKGASFASYCSQYAPGPHRYNAAFEGAEPMGPPPVLPPLKPRQLWLQRLSRRVGVRLWYRGEDWKPAPPLASSGLSDTDAGDLLGQTVASLKEEHGISADLREQVATDYQREVTTRDPDRSAK